MAMHAKAERAYDYEARHCDGAEIGLVGLRIHHNEGSHGGGAEGHEDLAHEQQVHLHLIETNHICTRAQWPEHKSEITVKCCTRAHSQQEKS